MKTLMVAFAVLLVSLAGLSCADSLPQAKTFCDEAPGPLETITLGNKKISVLGSLHHSSQSMRDAAAKWMSVCYENYAAVVVEVWGGDRTMRNIESPTPALNRSQQELLKIVFASYSQFLASTPEIQPLPLDDVYAGVVDKVLPIYAIETAEDQLRPWSKISESVALRLADQYSRPERIAKEISDLRGVVSLWLAGSYRRAIQLATEDCRSSPLTKEVCELTIFGRDHGMASRIFQVAEIASPLLVVVGAAHLEGVMFELRMRE